MREGIIRDFRAGLWGKSSASSSHFFLSKARQFNTSKQTTAMSKHSSDQSASMGRTDSEEEEEADTSFLDEDFLSFSATDNGGSKPNGRKRSRSTSPVPDYNNGRFVDISVPWLDRSQKRHGHNTSGSSGRGYNSYYEPPPLIKLHNEMVSFVKLMEPTRQELEIRDVMVKRVQDLAVRTFGKKVSCVIEC